MASWWVDTNSPHNWHMQIATQLSGGGTSSGALMVWGLRAHDLVELGRNSLVLPR